MSSLKAYFQTMASLAPLSQPPPSQSPNVLNRVAIPGGYGLPVIGPLADRLKYFWFEGPNTFFKNKKEKYNSTVFRTNIPPSFPFFVRVNPNVIAVLDVKSFSHLFDMEIVEKANVLVGDFMPSVNFTGGLRVCAYLDASDPKHSQVKGLAMDILKRSSTIWVSSMVTSLDTMWESIESQLSATTTTGGGTTGGTAIYLLPLQRFLFTFLSRCLLGADPTTDPEIAKSGYTILDWWLAFQLLPTVSVGLGPIGEIFLHSFTYPSWLVRSGYSKLAKFVKNQAQETLLRAQSEFNLTEEEAIHNLVFILGFNAYGGFSVFLPSLLKALGDNKSAHEKLRAEVRKSIEQNNGTLSFESVKEMELVNSFVFETLRLNPPVPLQFARARKDFDLTSHDATFSIKKGELLCGYQPLVMRDSVIFENPEDFVYDRFRFTKGGEELLKYVYWSNGPQSGAQGPTTGNKQCPAREVVPMTAALFLADLFQRYDNITISSGFITALQKAK